MLTQERSPGQQLESQMVVTAITDIAPPVRADRTLEERLSGVRQGLLFKRLTLLIGAIFFTSVCITNLVNFIAVTTGRTWTVLNSGNAAYIGSITKSYSFPHRFDEAAVLVAAVVEGIGALLFWRAVRRFRGEGTGVREAWWALTWNVVVWLGFIIGTEVFVAYSSEGPFRELLLLALAMALVVAVVPDDATS